MSGQCAMRSPRDLPASGGVRSFTSDDLLATLGAHTALHRASSTHILAPPYYGRGGSAEREDGGAIPCDFGAHTPRATRRIGRWILAAARPHYAFFGLFASSHTTRA